MLYLKCKNSYNPRVWIRWSWEETISTSNEIKLYSVVFFIYQETCLKMRSLQKCPLFSDDYLEKCICLLHSSSILLVQTVFIFGTNNNRIACFNITVSSWHNCFSIFLTAILQRNRTQLYTKRKHSSTFFSLYAYLFWMK